MTVATEPALTPGPDPVSPGAPARGATFALLVATALVHLPAMARYGWFRDELYYLSCAKRLAWGYVDQPPLSIAVLAAWRAIVGDSLVGCGWCGARRAPHRRLADDALARRARRWSRSRRCSPASAHVASLIYLGGRPYYSMNVLDLAALAARGDARCCAHSSGNGSRDWAWLGVVVGLGLLNKWSMLWLAPVAWCSACSCAAGGAVLATPGPWLAAALAAAMFAPHLAWQVRARLADARVHAQRDRAQDGRELDPRIPHRAGAGHGPAGGADLARGARRGAARAARATWGSCSPSSTRRCSHSWSSCARHAPTTWRLPTPGFSHSAPWRSSARRPHPAATRGTIAAVALPLAAMLALLPFALPVLPPDAYVALPGRARPQARRGGAPPHGRAAAALRRHVRLAGVGRLGGARRPRRSRRRSGVARSSSWTTMARPAHSRCSATAGCRASPVSTTTGTCGDRPRGTAPWRSSWGATAPRWRRNATQVRVVGIAGHPLAMPYERDMPIVIARHFHPDLAAAWKQGKHYQ